MNETPPLSPEDMGLPSHNLDSDKTDYAQEVRALEAEAEKLYGNFFIRVSRHEAVDETIKIMEMAYGDSVADNKSYQRRLEFQKKLNQEIDKIDRFRDKMKWAKQIMEQAESGVDINPRDYGFFVRFVVDVATLYDDFHHKYGYTEEDLRA